MVDFNIPCLKVWFINWKRCKFFLRYDTKSQGCWRILKQMSFCHGMWLWRYTKLKIAEIMNRSKMMAKMEAKWGMILRQGEYVCKVEEWVWSIRRTRWKTFFPFQTSIGFCPQYTKDTRNLTIAPNISFFKVGNHLGRLIKVIHTDLQTIEQEKGDQFKSSKLS